MLRFVAGLGAAGNANGSPDARRCGRRLARTDAILQSCRACVWKERTYCRLRTVLLRARSQGLDSKTRVVRPSKAQNVYYVRKWGGKRATDSNCFENLRNRLSVAERKR
jgi:hypothetical protein